MKIIASFFALFTTALFFAQSDARFRITENNKIGYINAKGEIVIQPVYINGGNFSDGVAAVRENGLYGFIDTNSKYIIQPQYDYASYFYKDFALVYKNGKREIINKKGEKALPDVFHSISILSDHTAIVSTKTRKRGLYSLKDKKLLTDTIYSSIGEFRKGVSIATTMDNNYCLIDSLGNTIVQPGIYSEIESFSDDGYAVVSSDEQYKSAVIDTKGKVLFKYHNEYSSLRGKFNNGYIAVYDYSFTEKPKDAKFDRGYLNATGKLIFSDPDKNSFESFSNNRAFISYDRNYKLINEKFEVLGDSVFKNIAGEYENNVFVGDYAVVQALNYKWGVIDTNGVYVIKPRFNEIHDCGVLDEYVFFREYDADDNAHYGICNLNDEIILKPIVDFFDTNGFIDGLLMTFINDKLTYINKEGGVIWQEKDIDTTKQTVRSLNIDYMLRGYFYAYSKTEKHNGWGRSDNMPKKIGSKNFPKKQLSLVISPEEKAVFEEEFNGCKVYLANTSGKKATINASDSRLEIILQAQDNNGNWRDIEYTPKSWCGNSYHNVYLESGEYWDFTMPLYDGTYKTKIRAVLSYFENKKEKIVYSNVIDGNINPAQFFNKRTYSPNGLMDPYSE